MTAQVHLLEPAARWSRDEADALHALAGNVQGLPVQWCDCAWQLTLRPLIAQEGLQACEGEWRIRFSWSGLPFDLIVPAEGAQAWVQARFPALDLPALPDPFVAAAFEDACESLVGLLPGGTPSRVRLEKWHAADAESPRLPHAVLVELHGGEVVLRAHLSTSRQGLLHMASLARAHAPTRRGLEASTLPVTLQAVIGMTWLSLEDLARLKPRDTILFDVRILEQDGTLWVGQGAMGFRAMRQGSDLTVTEQFMEREWITPPDDEAGVARAELSALDHLPLRVVFDLGELSMTVAQLETLQVGQPLALSRPLASAVSLRVNGALIGTGELVDIEGELGVTITSLFQRPAGKSPRATRSGGRARPRTAPDAPEEVSS